MPQWNTSDRGVMRDSENSYYDHTDFDGLSDLDIFGLPGESSGYGDIESIRL